MDRTVSGTDAITTLGVVGAGVMGVGIAQLGCMAGLRTTLCDADHGALERAAVRMKRDLERGAARGGWSRAAGAAAVAQLELHDAIDGLHHCDVVIEAVPEVFAIKE